MRASGLGLPLTVLVLCVASVVSVYAKPEHTCDLVGRDELKSEFPIGDSIGLIQMVREAYSSRDVEDDWNDLGDGLDLENLGSDVDTVRIHLARMFDFYRLKECQRRVDSVVRAGRRAISEVSLEVKGDRAGMALLQRDGDGELNVVGCAVLELIDKEWSLGTSVDLCELTWPGDQYPPPSLLVKRESFHRSEVVPECVFPHENQGMCGVLAVVRRLTSHVPGACGSCWAMATLRVLGESLCVMTDGKTRLVPSVEEAINCARSNKRKARCAEGGEVDDVVKYGIMRGYLASGHWPYTSGSLLAPLEVTRTISAFVALNTGHGGTARSVMTAQTCSREDSESPLSHYSPLAFVAGVRVLTKHSEAKALLARGMPVVLRTPGHMMTIEGWSHNSGGALQWRVSESFIMAHERDILADQKELWYYTVRPREKDVPALDSYSIQVTGCSAPSTSSWMYRGGDRSGHVNAIVTVPMFAKDLDFVSVHLGDTGAFESSGAWMYIRDCKPEGPLVSNTDVYTARCKIPVPTMWVNGVALEVRVHPGELWQQATSVSYRCWREVPDHLPIRSQGVTAPLRPGLDGLD